MRDQEKFLPEIRRNPGSYCACNEQAARDIFPNGGPVHDEVVTRRCEAIVRCDALPKRPFRHAHVHFGVTFHLTFESFVRLRARLSNELARQEPF